MTEEQKRIAIAEACGWKWKDNKQRKEAHWYAPSGMMYLNPPDYFHDLNACHEMEKTIRPPQKPTWDMWEDFFRRFEDDPHATAAQRAEAFGKTLGLW